MLKTQTYQRPLVSVIPGQPRPVSTMYTLVVTVLPFCRPRVGGDPSLIKLDSGLRCAGMTE